MKKFFFSFVAVSVLLASCAKEVVKTEEEVSGKTNLVEMSFTVSVDTKARLNDDRSVSFAANDKIAVFANGNKYEFTTTEGGATAVFTGSVAEGDQAAGTFYAVSPFAAATNAAISEGVISGLTISSGTAGTGTNTFNSQKAVAVAITNNSSFEFKQLTALLKVTVPADVTDLKEIIVFNRDNGASNTAGAITGTFSVTPALNGEPVIAVTSPSFQTGFVGPNGSSQAVPAGDYYMPVLPAKLTANKGIDLKITFMDNFVGRAFNGSGLQLERGRVYNLGTVARTDTFVYDSFEKNPLTDYTGNPNALSIVENPYKTATNPSNYVLKNQVSGTGGTSGYIQVNTTNDYGYTRFPSSVRGNYDVVRVKVYLGTNAYYPTCRRGSNTAARPYKINGVLLNNDQSVWDANVKTNDWNILDYKASDIDSGWSSFTSLGTLEFRPLVDWGKNNVENFDETTNNRLVYFDDISFVLK